MRKISLLIISALFLFTCENNNENIEGCLNETACNYNENANVSDGSCEYAQENLDCEGNCINDTDADGVCDENENAGCTDSTACNYDENATDDNGSCQFPLENLDCEGNCLNDTDGDGICDENENTSWVFVANEGNYGASNGSISMIDDSGNIFETEPLGDVVQALEVYEDKLIVLVNNSHMIKIFDITDDGLNMPGIEVSTGNSSPRDLTIIDGKIYFTNWNSQDVKVFDLFTYAIESSISINGLPEDIEFDGQYLWVTVPHSDFYFSTGNTVIKIDPTTNSISEIIEVGDGPQQIAFDNGEVYVSRTFYSDTWETFHGATKITDGETITENYGAGTACGGSILKYQNNVYRSFDGGLSPMNADLSLDSDNKIGNYDQSLVYHVELVDGNFWFGLTNYSDLNEVKVVNSIGEEIGSYNAGLLPGDFAFWKN